MISLFWLMKACEILLFPAFLLQAAVLLSEPGWCFCCNSCLMRGSSTVTSPGLAACLLAFQLPSNLGWILLQVRQKLLNTRKRMEDILAGVTPDDDEEWYDTAEALAQPLLACYWSLWECGETLACSALAPLHVQACSVLAPLHVYA